MATFGIEGIRYFANAQANKVTTAADFTYTFNICNGLDEALRDAGHTRGFYWANQDCWESDIRDTDQGGDDVTPWNGGNVAWERSHLNRDHLWGHGNVDADLAPSQQACLLRRRDRTLLRLTDGRRAVAYHASGALEFHGGIEPMADLFEEMSDTRHLTSVVKKAAGRLDAPHWVGRDERLVFERLWRIKAAAADARAKMVPHAHDKVLADSACQTLLAFEAERCWLSRNLTPADGGSSRSCTASAENGNSTSSRPWRLTRNASTVRKADARIIRRCELLTNLPATTRLRPEQTERQDSVG